MEADAPYDTIDHLRHHEAGATDDYWRELFGRAADEIERLRSQLEIELKAKSETVESLAKDCAEGLIPFGELCAKVRAMGYKTTSLYEMVRAHEAQIKLRNEAAKQ